MCICSIRGFQVDLVGDCLDSISDSIGSRTRDSIAIKPIVKKNDIYKESRDIVGATRNRCLYHNNNTRKRGRKKPYAE